MRTLVLGIGNTLLSDEGVGVHVIQALRDTPSPADDEIEYLDGGTLSFTLAVPIEAADALIVVDAAQLRGEPGSLRVFQGEGMDRFLGDHHKASVHEVGLLDLMAIARLAGRWPARRALVAIQPERVDWGETPTPRVAAAVPIACQQIRDLIGAWRHDA